MSMRDPRNYFINPFQSRNISDNEMAAVTTDHIGKLGNQNSEGDWTARIAATAAAMAAFDDGITDNMTQGDFRKARKLAKNNLREALPKAVAGIAKWVEAEFGEGSPQVVQVIGSGVTTLYRLPDDEVENYLKKVIDGLTPLIGNGVDQARLTDATALKAQWDTIYAASEQSTADKRLSEEERRAAREVLEDVLFETLLMIAQANRGNPDILGNFFTPSLAGGPALSGGGGGGGGVDENSSEESESSDSSLSSSSSFEPSSSSYDPPSSSWIDPSSSSYEPPSSSWLSSSSTSSSSGI